MSSEEEPAGIQHAVECPDCGEDTYQFERHCHHCGFDRWEES